MEEILHYKWKFRLFQKDLVTTDGQPIEVIDVGLPNTNEGPDFFNAKIEIEGKVWAGNIEIHRCSEDWYSHKHNLDKGYNSVILHIVEYPGKEIFNEAEKRIPQCRIKYPRSLKDNIEYLLNADVAIPCCNYLSSFPKLHLSAWMNTLLVERLERKANDIFRLLERFNNSGEERLYILLTRNFGFGLNSDAFERLAISLPLSCIRKHADNIGQIVALWFGQAGLLDEEYDDKYFQTLKREYGFLSHKYSLQAVDANLFRRMRVRPQGSPYIRLA